MAAKRSKSKTALRGAVNNIIMESLFSGEKYGYEIIKEVEEKTNGKIKLKQPSLYSSLKRFETKGYIESYWQDSDIGGKRHYYKLTPSGITYYKKHVAKEEDFEDDIEEEIIEKQIEDDFENLVGFEISDNEEYIEDKISEYEIDSHEESHDLTKYEYDVEDQINSLINGEESKEDLLDELYDKLDEEPVIFSEEDLETEQSLKEQIIADHEFSTPTPLTSKLSNDEIVDNAFNDIIEESKNDSNIFDDINLDNLKEESKASPTPTIITDEDGITKMYYEKSDEKPRTNKVFDNVVYRTHSQDLYSSINKKQQFKEEVLTDEEKELKSKRFFEKFDSKSEQIMKEKQLAKANQPKKEEPVENKIDYNYKSKLNNLFDTMNDNIEDETYTVEEVSFDEDNNFLDEDDFRFDTNYNDDSELDLQQNAFVEKDVDYTVKVYTEEKAKDPTIKYLQVNKAKFTFGLTMLIFMLFQVTIMLIVFKNKELLLSDQFWVFQLSYLIVGIVTLIYCVPVFISPNKQSSNNFKLGYSLMFGCLSFFIVVILTYAINTFMGMELFNIKYYLATLIVPIALSLNFIFGPLIYWLITQNKKFY